MSDKLVAATDENRSTKPTGRRSRRLNISYQLIFGLTYADGHPTLCFLLAKDNALVNRNAKRHPSTQCRCYYPTL